MVHLIARPADYRGVEVFVSGYSRLSRGRLFLFLTEEHARANDIQSAVIVGSTLDGREMESISGCHDRFVTVFGRFDALDGGLAVLMDIARVIAYGPHDEIEGDCYALVASHS
jgi:hypothetical protein